MIPPINTLPPTSPIDPRRETEWDRAELDRLRRKDAFAPEVRPVGDTSGTSAVVVLAIVAGAMLTEILLSLMGF